MKRIGLKKSFLLLLLFSQSFCSQAKDQDQSQSNEAISQVLVEGADESVARFSNPIVNYGADPWVIQKDGWYYWCYSDGASSIYIVRAKNLHELGKVPAQKVWQAPPGQMYSHETWAPELHFINDKWYIYFAADGGMNKDHRIFVLEGISSDPLDSYVFKGRVSSEDDHWAIDPTVYKAGDGRLYLLWSGWDGDIDVQQNIYIAEMENPWTLAAGARGRRVAIASPVQAWERKTGRPYVNEGPQILERGNRVFIIYSANGSWTDAYGLGQLTLKGSDLLQPTSWEKKGPVFSATNEVFGPGHASFTKSPNGKEDWIVYHAAKRRGSGWDRNIRAQKFTFDADGSPDFGRPLPLSSTLPVPGEL